MKTITTDQISERLKKSFTNVKPFSRFESNILNARDVFARTVSVINLDGLDLIIGCYSTNTEREIELDGDNVKWNRYVICAGKNRAYYF